MENANQLSWALVAALFLGLAACRDEAPAAPSAPKTVADHFDIGVGGRTAHLQVAVLQAELERGLMERRDLGPDEGMIFVFDAPQRLSFWMRDTPTALDIGYFSADGQLAEIYPLLPYDERPVQSLRADLQLAVEMGKGWYAGAGVRPGARLDTAALAGAIRERGFDPRKFGLVR